MGFQVWESSVRSLVGGVMSQLLLARRVLLKKTAARIIGEDNVERLE